MDGANALDSFVNAVASGEGEGARGIGAAAEKDTAKAVASMQRYFDKGTDSTIIGRDYLTMGDFLAATSAPDSLSMVYYGQGVAQEKDSLVRYRYLRKLADFAGGLALHHATA